MHHSMINKGEMTNRERLAEFSSCTKALTYSSDCLCSPVTAQAAGRGKGAAGVGNDAGTHIPSRCCAPGSPWHSGAGRRAQQPQPLLQDSPELLLAAAGATAASTQHRDANWGLEEGEGRAVKKERRGGRNKILKPRVNGKTLEPNAGRMKPAQYNIVQLNSQPCIIPSSH